MLNENGIIYMVKNIWRRCKQMRTHCCFVASYYVVSYYVVSYYVVSYYRFLNTDPDWR
jgi:hypothetical protein